MSQTLKEIYKSVEAENNIHLENMPIIPIDLLNQKMKKKDIQRTQYAISVLENITNEYGFKVFHDGDKFSINKNLLEAQIIKSKIADSKFDPIIKEAMLNVYNDELLTEGFLQKAAEIANKVKEKAAEVASAANDATGAVVDKTKKVASKIKNFMDVAIEEARKIKDTFIKAMGEFGTAFLKFLEGFGEINLKAGWVMFKEGKFLEMGKAVGNYLLNRFADAFNVYQKIFDVLNKGVFANLAKSKPIDGLRNFLQENLQDNLDQMFQPDTTNKEIKDIVEKKYLDNAAETVSKTMKEQFNPSNPEHMKLAWKQAKEDAMNDTEVIRATMKDQGVSKTAKMIALRTGIGAGLAYLAFWTWNNMIFKGELIYDYDFTGAVNAVMGKYNIADWFLSDDGGFETLLWLFGGLAGFSIADWFGSGNLTVAAIVTVIAIWIRKNPGTWDKIKNSDFAKNVIKVYNDSKKKIESGYNSAKQAFGDLIKKATIFTKFGLMKTSPVKA
jgi:hypothetical protein